MKRAHCRGLRSHSLSHRVGHGFVAPHRLNHSHARAPSALKSGTFRPLSRDPLSMKLLAPGHNVLMPEPDLLFSAGRLADVLDNQARLVDAAAQAIPAEHALARSIDELAAELVERYEIEPVVLDWSGVTLSSDEVKIDVTYDPRRGFFGDEGRVHVAGTRLTFHVPLSGESKLLKLRPSHYTSNPPRGAVSATELRLVSEAPVDSRDGLKGVLEAEADNVRRYLDFASADLTTWSATLPKMAHDGVEHRRQQVIADREFVASIGVPLRRREDARPTYAVAPIRRQVTKPPTSGHRPSAPEPFLPNEEYERILEICRGMATVLERSPRAFARAGEQAIRDHFLVQLNGQYQGEAMGETFNNEGKTDILVREKGSNLFIGECKFWDGPQNLSDTVDQILRYLTWRDTKSAIFLFNCGRELTKVLAAISPTIAEHPSFVREIDYGTETDRRFVLRHRDDPEREMTLTVLTFEVPTV